MVRSYDSYASFPVSKKKKKKKNGLSWPVNTMASISPMSDKSVFLFEDLPQIICFWNGTQIEIILTQDRSAQFALLKISEHLIPDSWVVQYRFNLQI